MSRALRRPGLLLPSVLILFGVSCGDSTGPDSTDIRDFINAIATVNGSTTAAFRSGAAPSEGSGPTVVVSGTSAMILGGGTIRTVSSSSAFTRIIVAIAGVDGFWELTLPAAVSEQDIVLTLAQDLPDDETSFDVRYAAGTSAAIGNFDTEAVTVVVVGTGDIQVSVSWDAESDVDLHLVEPGGEEIYYGNETSASGGTLDLDSNAGCFIDGTKNENITWPSNTPPRGTYTVRVDYWDACGVGVTNWVVTVRVRGRNAVTFTGTFTGPGDQGGEGAGLQVTSFTF